MRFPNLAEVLKRHGRHGSFNCKCRAAVAPAGDCHDRPTHEQHVVDAWREACTIATVEQLDALPDGATIRDGDGITLTRNPRDVYPSNTRPWWPLSGYSALERDFGVETTEIPLPALLIWHPEWSQP